MYAFARSRTMCDLFDRISVCERERAPRALVGGVESYDVASCSALDCYKSTPACLRLYTPEHPQTPPGA